MFLPLEFFIWLYIQNSRLICGLLKVTKKKEENKKKNVTLDILQPSRYKPNDLEQMARETRFTKDEVRYLYRAFKQECPNGIVDEETFKDVYEKIFPLGDASHYAHLVFAAIDRRVISFDLKASYISSRIYNLKISYDFYWLILFSFLQRQDRRYHFWWFHGIFVRY